MTWGEFKARVDADPTVHDGVFLDSIRYHAGMGDPQVKVYVGGNAPWSIEVDQEDDDG